MRKIAIFLCALIILSVIPLSASANPYPQAFWSLNDKYIAAQNAANDADIVTYATQICALFEGRTDEIAVSILSSRYYELANAHDRLGNYEASGEAYEKSIPYFELLSNYGIDGSENIKIASTKAKLYESVLDLYRTTYGYQTYYGAINEKRMGVLYGVNHDGGTQEKMPGDSLVLIYQNFGDTNIIPFNKIQLAKAADEGCAVEFALNLPGEGADVTKVLSSTDYILTVIEMLNEVDTPIFLRFAAEMDVWTTQCAPADYIAAFKYVADLVHANTDHVAMVWSPTYASGWNINKHDFYPGDEYVDWIGVSLYLQTYFNARDNWSKQERIALPCFFGGDAAIPVKIMEDLISTYGDRKPFIISECGSSHQWNRLNGQSVKIDTTSWAIQRLTAMFKYLPMAYPQIKAIAYFDKIMPNENCYFALDINPALQMSYLNLVKDDAYIQNSYDDEANATYEKLPGVFLAEQGITELRTMAIYYGKDNVTVTYLIDGNPVATSATLPYTVSVDLSKYAVGNHTLTIRATANGAVLGERSYTMSLAKAADVYVNGDLLELAQKPVIVEGTTLVPLRAIVEKLGGNVEWINETREIIITDASTEIKLRIGSYDMVTNGVTSSLLVPARLINSTTYIPLRAVSEAMKATVAWHGETRSITIDK